MLAQLQKSLLALTLVATGTMTAKADHVNGQMIQVSECLITTACELHETVELMNMPCFVERRTEILHRRAIRINERIVSGDSLYVIRGDLIGLRALLPTTQRWVERYSRAATCHSRVLMEQMCDHTAELMDLVDEAIRCQRESRRRPVVTPRCATPICPTTIPGRSVLPPPVRYDNPIPHGDRHDVRPHVAPRNLAPPAPEPTWFNNSWQTRSNPRSSVSTEMLLSFLLSSLQRT